MIQIRVFLLVEFVVRVILQVLKHSQDVLLFADCFRLHPSLVALRSHVSHSNKRLDVSTFCAHESEQDNVVQQDRSVAVQRPFEEAVEELLELLVLLELVQAPALFLDQR